MNNNYYDLKGKTALITGAAGLLGKEHAAALAALGATVVLTDISKNNLQNVAQKLKTEFSEEQIQTYVMDVTSITSIKSVQEQVNNNGQIDILINNAAIDPKVNADNNLVEISRFEHFPLSLMIGPKFCEISFARYKA